MSERGEGEPTWAQQTIAVWLIGVVFLSSFLGVLWLMDHEIF